MKQEEYVKTIIFRGRMINIGLDDEGQCYFIEYLNDKGELEEVCGYSWCGYEGFLEDYFDVLEGK